MLVGLAAAAAAISAYLTIAHYSGGGLICTQGGVVDCETVTTSSYSLIPGTQVPISLAGLLWSVVSGALALAPARARSLHVLWAAAGLAVVLYLVNAEIAVIHRVCEWCTALHLAVAATFFVALSRFRRSG